MLTIIIGLAIIVFRKRLMAHYMRSTERWWSAKFVGDPRPYEWLLFAVGAFFVAAGLAQVLPPR